MLKNIKIHAVDNKKQLYIKFILSQYDKKDKKKHIENLKYLESLSDNQLEKIYNNLKHF